MKTKNNLLVLAFFASSIFSFQASATSVYDYNFYRITDTAPENIGNQLLMNVSSSASSKVAFKFSNNIGVQSSITDIYFDNGTTNLFKSFSMYSDSDTGIKTDVVFDNKATPANLPGGGSLTPKFIADFSGDSSTPTSKKGLNATGEWVTYMGVLSCGKSFDMLTQALRSGDFRVGLHVQSIGVNGESDSYLNNKLSKAEMVSAVPLPAAAWLFGSALLGFITVSNRRRV